MTVIVPPSGRPGQGGQHDHLREGSYTLAVAGASWRRSGAGPSDRQLLRRYRPGYRAPVITWTLRVQPG
jgi:hypothetical protein